MNTQNKYSALLFSTSYLDNADANELAQLRDYIDQHDVKVGIVTNYLTSDTKKWLKTAPLRVDTWTCGGSIKESRHVWYRKPMPQVMSVTMGKLRKIRSEVLSVCWNDIDLEASEKAYIDCLMRPSPAELIPMLTDAPRAETPAIDLSMPAPLTGVFGAMVGDMVGAPHEHKSGRTKNPKFKFKKDKWRSTDDSVLTMAVAEWLMSDRSREALDRQFTIWCFAHYKCGFGHDFMNWLDSKEHGSRYATSNGAAMRVVPVGIAAKSLEECLELADFQARMTHNSDEASNGAQAIAACVFLTRTGKSKEEIKAYIEDTFKMDLNRTIQELRDGYDKDEPQNCNCLRCASEAIICWLQSDGYEQTIRNSISLGGDADTIAAMAGGIAACTKGMEIPQEIAEECYNLLSEDLKQTLITFENHYNNM